MKTAAKWFLRLAGCYMYVVGTMSAMIFTDPVLLVAVFGISALTGTLLLILSGQIK